MADGPESEVSGSTPLGEESADEPIATQPQKVVRNAAAGYLALGTSAVSGLLLTPLLIRGLGTELFGVLSVGLSATGFLGLFDAGVGTAVVTRVAHTQTRRRDVEGVTGTATGLYLLACVATLVVGAFVSWYSPSLFHAQRHADATRAMFAVLTVGQMAALLTNVPSGSLQGTGRFGSVAARGAFFALIGSVVQAVIALTTHSLAWVAGVTAALGFFILVNFHRLARRVVAGYTLSPRGAQRDTARSILQLSSKNAAIYIAGSLGYGSDLLIVGAMLGTRDAAIYSIASRASLFVRGLASRLADTLSGSYATLSATEQRARAWALYLRSVRVSLLILLPLSVALIAFGRPLLVDWVGNAGHHSYPILVPLAVTGVVQVAGYGALTLVVGLERSDLIARLAVAAGVGNLIVSIALTRAVGRIGPAYGSLATALVFDLLALPIIAAKVCDVRPSTIWSGLLPLMPALVAQLIASVVIVVVGGDHGYVAILASVASVGVFGLGCASSGTLRVEARQILNAFRGRSAQTPLGS